MKRVVIVCYTFPPYPGIGGRRWAKFARCLHEKGHDIQVIAAEKILEQESAWLQDTKGYQDRVHFLPSKYPQVLTTVPNNIWQRLEYRLALAYVKFRNRKGNYFDPSSFFGPVASDKVEHYIQQGYNNVIISCGPFRMTGDLLKLKDRYPHVNFILDFRDPWANNKTAFGFQSIGAERLKGEIELEKEVITKADCIISVSEEMNDYFHQTHGKNTTSMLCVPNGLDVADFKDAVEKSGLKLNKNWVFTGTLYPKSERVFARFCEVLQLLNQSGEWPLGMKLEFYGSVPNWFYKHTEKLGDKVQYLGNISLSQTYETIAQSAACMLFLTDDLTYSKSTKFYEYIAMKKPVLVMSSGGETGNYVAEQGLGYNCTGDHMMEKIKQAAKEIDNGIFQFPEGYNVHVHDVMHLTDYIIERLEENA